MKPTQGLGGFRSCRAWAFPWQTPCWWWMQDLIRETRSSMNYKTGSNARKYACNFTHTHTQKCRYSKTRECSSGCIPELKPQCLPRWSLYSLQPARCSRPGQGWPLLWGCCSMWRTRISTEGWQGLAQPLQKLQSLTTQSWAGCWHQYQERNVIRGNPLLQRTIKLHLNQRLTP